VGANAQVFIKTAETYEVFGNLGTDIIRSALSGKITDQADDYVLTSNTDIFHEAGGDIIRNATGDIVDIATDLDRQGSGTITDTATAIVHVPPV
jgi:hypothetical protein